MIGRMVLMPELHQVINNSPLILIKESAEVRIENTFGEYIRHTALGYAASDEDLNAAHLVFESFRNSLKRITNKLGGQRTAEIMNLINACEIEYNETRGIENNRAWIAQLLTQYYDPMYEYGLKNREGKIIFEGIRSEAFDFMNSLSSQFAQA